MYIDLRMVMKKIISLRLGVSAVKRTAIKCLLLLRTRSKV